MLTPAHYEADVLFFFDGKPLEHSLYEALLQQLDAVFPDTSVKVQKARSAFMPDTSLPPYRFQCAAGRVGRSTACLSPSGCPTGCPRPVSPWLQNRTPTAGHTMWWWIRRGSLMPNCWAG